MSSTPLDIKPAERRKLTETVATELLEEFRRRRLAPGTRIPSERELRALMGVGRSTIREALNGLSLLGVIEIHHGRGIFITASPADLEARQLLSEALREPVTRDLIEARMTVEAEVFGLAAERRTQEDLREIEEQLRACEAAVAKSEPAAGPGVKFHLAIARAARNEVLSSFVASISHLLVERGPELEGIPGYREWELADHGRLFEAVRSGDGELARQRLRRHLSAVIEYYRQIGLEMEGPLAAERVVAPEGDDAARGASHRGG